MQLTSHSCSMDSKDPVAKSLNINKCCASSENLEDSCIFACDVGVMKSPFSTFTWEPYAGFKVLYYYIASSLK